MGIINLKFIESAEIIEFLGRIGVLFLLFYLGLEFSVGKLIKSGRSIAVSGTVYVLLNFVLGLAYGFLTGFPLYETLVIAGMVFVSSTAIVAKVLVDLRRTGNSETELILGIILFDDIFLAVFLSVMSGILLSGGTSLGAVLLTILANFVAGMIAGRKAGLSHKASVNIGLTIVSRGEFTIIVANLGVAGGLLPILKPMSALYVLILAILGPLLTKESKRIYTLLDKLFKWSTRNKKDKPQTAG
ncbi:cation:proton antiporter [Aneurinibacillus sp. BA2021]|nr:cation:proton antiporter [Aneurinibacillus sp. BA2021]